MDQPILEKLEGLAAAFNAHDIDRIMSFFASECSLDMPRGQRQLRNVQMASDRN
jgi:hypothetical protein